MKAHEIMTTDVTTVGLTTTVKEIATLLVNKRISAVPVVDDEQHVIGIVSESDLFHRAETDTERKRSWWLKVFTDTDVLARDYVKSHGLKAEDIMSRVVTSVHEKADLAEVADILDTHRIRRVPVVKEGKLIGLISRADIVRALIQAEETSAGAKPDDSALQTAILKEIRSQSWLSARSVSVTVKNGVAELWGLVDSEEERKALHVLVEAVDGVQGVDDHVRLYPPMVAA